jgi:hypothetical protein
MAVNHGLFEVWGDGSWNIVEMLPAILNLLSNRLTTQTAWLISFSIPEMLGLAPARAGRHPATATLVCTEALLASPDLEVGFQRSRVFTQSR